ERRRDLGAALAAANNAERSMRAELAMLDALLAAPGATATADVIANDLAAVYPGGQWIGATILRMVRAGIMREVGLVRSNRPSRHRGRTGQYAIADCCKAERRRTELHGLLAALPRPATEQLRQGNLF